MERVEYPKWKYSYGKEPVLVKDKAADDALGSAWVESPALIKEPKNKVMKSSDAKEGAKA